MRELILKMAMSVDGFVSDLEGRNTWMFGADQEAKAWGVEAISAAGLHIMGARSFRGMAAYWQTSGDMFAPAMNQIPKAVFSRQGSAILEGLDTGACWPRRAHRTGQPSCSPAPRPGRRLMWRTASWRRRSPA